jgi:hypothetical protein
MRELEKWILEKRSGIGPGSKKVTPDYHGDSLGTLLKPVYKYLSN